MSFIGDVLGGLWEVFISGPLSNPDVLYVLIPVYLNWVVNDYYQERKGTSLGNAAANGFTAIWVGVDWFRQMVPRAALVKVWSFSWYFLVFKFLAAALVLFYGLVIMKYAVSGNQLAKKIGRIREVSYICIVFTPFVYDLIRTGTPSLSSFLPTFVGILLFFPIFYFAAEFILNALPAPVTELDEEEEAAQKQKPARKEFPRPLLQDSRPKPAQSQQRPAQPAPQQRPAQPSPQQNPQAQPAPQKPQQQAQPPRQQAALSYQQGSDPSQQGSKPQQQSSSSYPPASKGQGPQPQYQQRPQTQPPKEDGF